ncbi:Uncharacterised protein [Shigella sonnei]|nr:Uncharacterised protein [Shigella sonnei]
MHRHFFAIVIQLPRLNLSIYAMFIKLCLNIRQIV